MHAQRSGRRARLAAHRDHQGQGVPSRRTGRKLNVQLIQAIDQAGRRASQRHGRRHVSDRRRDTLGDASLHRADHRTSDARRTWRRPRCRTARWGRHTRRVASRSADCKSSRAETFGIRRSCCRIRVTRRIGPGLDELPLTLAPPIPPDHFSSGAGGRTSPLSPTIFPPPR